MIEHHKYIVLLHKSRIRFFFFNPLSWIAVLITVSRYLDKGFLALIVDNVNSIRRTKTGLVHYYILQPHHVMLHTDMTSMN
ncbi:hypothetical protein I7I48_07187 [Histoplasma ohiense]|nr:hypothetical protein I7I48_07187 [Histoplasma ohiense (nom. inval.)]